MIKIQQETVAVQEQRTRSSNEAFLGGSFQKKSFFGGHQKACLFVIHCQTGEGEGAVELSWFAETASFLAVRSTLGGLA